jgi:two-component system, NtrC family, sensor kinase
MQCPRCQQQNSRQADFCLKCGTSLKGTSTTASSYAHLKTEVESLRGAVTESLEQQTATSEILRVISTSPSDIHPIFAAIASTAVRLCGARIATVFRYDGELIHLIAHHGYTAEALELRRGLFPAPAHAGSVTGRAILNRTVVHVPDVLADGTYPYRNFARAADVRSVVAVPMLRDGRPIGVITVSRAEPGAFAERHIEVLKTFADQAVVAVETVRLVTELEMRNRELTETLAQQAGTGDVLRIISTSPTELQPVLDAVVKSAAQLCGAYDAAVFQVDGESLRVAAHHGPLHGAIGLLLPVARGTVAGRSVLERRAVHVADLPTEAKEFPEGSAFARELGYRTTLSVPLLRQRTAVGAIQLRRAEMNPFTDGQVALLQTFADQAVIAIENARLFKELQARNADLTEALEQQTALGDILKAMTRSAFGLEPVLAAIVENAGRLCGAVQGAIHQFDGEFLKLGAAYRTPPEYLEYARGHPVRAGRGSASGRAAIERRPVHIHDVLADPDYQMFERQRMIGFRTFLAVPMLRDQTVLGVINLWKMQVAPFTEQQIQLLQTFADQAVIAIENVRLFTELQARNRDITEALEQQTATAEVLHAINRAQTDAQPVFDIIAASALRLCGAGYGQVALYDGELLHMAAFHNVNPEGIEALQRRFPAPADRGSAMGRAIQTRAVVQIPDVHEDPAYAFKSELQTMGFRSVLVVPMLRQGEPIGAIVVGRSERGLFPDKQIELLRTFAAQAVIAVENERLFKELQARTQDLTRSVEELRALGEVGQAVSSTLELETVLTTIVSRAVQLSSTDGGSIYEYDEATEEFTLRASHNLNAPDIELRRAIRLRKGEGATGRMAITHESVQLSDITAEGTYDSRLREALLRTGARAVLAVPLLREDHFIGSLVVSRNTPGTFPNERRPAADLRDAVGPGDPERPALPGDRGQESTAGGGQPPQVRVPRQYVPRAPHAAQCRHRLLRGVAPEDVRGAQRQAG